jgi:glycosyltransferase involved in cell wall biosynthesis
MREMTPVTCIMPTADRRQFVPAAVQMFLAQHYAAKELLIVDDGTDDIADLVPPHPQIRYFRETRRRSIGAKRNFACQEARGEIIMHWDDDDWYAPWRVRYQVDMLESGRFNICGIDRVLFVNPTSEKAWEYVYPRRSRPWVCGATFCYRKAFWRDHEFPDVNIGEDSRFVFSASKDEVRVLEENRFFVGCIHAHNTSRKHTGGRRWQARPIEIIHSIMGMGCANTFSAHNLT